MYNHNKKGDLVKKIRILLADDHPIVREGTRRVVEQEADFEIVGEAEDGEQAVKMAKEHSPDIALIDIVMPKLNGIEAARQIKESCPNVAVLALSAYDEDEFIIGLLEAGAAGYLLKSCRGRELVAAIRAVSEGQSVFHPSITSKALRPPGLASNKTLLRERPECLSEREVEVMRLAIRGLNNHEIAEELHLSLRTVQTYFTRLSKKLQVDSPTGALLLGLKEGWLSLDSSLPADN